jgi:hypothetical protein
MRFFVLIVFILECVAVLTRSVTVVKSSFPLEIRWAKWDYVLRLVVSAGFVLWAAWLLWSK